MKCPDDQQTGPLGTCVCKTGYVLGAAGCEPIPAGLGVDCSASGMCGAEPYSYCMETDRGSYCTSKGCKTSADCAFGYACDVPSGVCLRPPVGLYMTCQSDKDCADTEATYCDVFFSHSCLVQGCTVSPNNCFEGSECCDLSTFGVAQPLCIPAGSCTT
ncbi:MAG TPA: hypothetical protein VFQ61_12665 [Polyangiaceae bacterium]|nr:hypothetical protein [Polyangiaceae bacterium]